MARRSFSRKGSKRVKYSVENVGVSVTMPEEIVNGIHQNGQTIIPATDVQGVRAIKHLTVTLTHPGDGDYQYEFYWALVFVPQGYQANALFPYFSESQLQGSLYEPNQFVMACGYNDPSAGPIRIRSNVSRNLQSGDSVALVIGAKGQV
ncbi:hypothetical protein [Streptomyces sp. CBMA123]|uniref:hypothetical protein n=1 Tax=Streptomyces sp. CBMA123 TaxID=1896313 RepID=UPI00166211CB|nr:hypothetical protein [Streptomyces sp. CBMA123]